MTNVEIVRRAIEEIQNQGKLEVADEVYAPEWIDHSIWHAPVGADGAPTSDALPSTPEDVKSSYQFIRMVFPEVTTRIDALHAAADDRVVVIWTVLAKHRSGRQLAYRGMDVHRLEKGKIAEIWTTWDRLGLLQQLDLVAPTPELWARAAAL
jgi:predicted SnoaL-like aldol condensation-catalyzing enzyme